MFSKLFDKYISQKRLYFLILLIITLIFFCKNTDIAIMLFVSIIFACSLNPLVNRLTKKTNRVVATTIVVLSFLAVIALFIVPALYLGIYEIASFTKDFPTYINDINHSIKGIPVLKAIGITSINTEFITNAFSTSYSTIFDSILKFIADFSSALLYIFTAIILLFFFLIDKSQIKEFILKFFPSEYRESTDKMIVNVANKLSGYVIAQTLVSGSVWITMTIGLLLFKIKYAILLGIIAGVLSLIPVVGSAISLVICIIATYSTGIHTIIIVTILYTISHFIENHVVRPFVYSKFLNLHQIVVFIALLVGAKYQGVLGVILAPPFTMAIYILLQELYLKKMDA